MKEGLDMTYSITWDLDSIFPNGSESKELSQRMTQLTEQTKEYHQLITEWTPESAQGKEQFAEILTLQVKISNGFSQCNSFLTALISANTNDTKAKILSGDLYNLLPAIQLAETIFTKKITEISAEHWQDLLAEEPFKTMAFRLNELRRDGKKLLSEQEENIINTLSLDGLNAWSTHYDTIVASIVIPFEEKDGSVTELSAGQAFNRMMGDPDKEVRQRLFTAWEKAWSGKASILADTLNHLDGFRLSDYKLHGTTDYLENPLNYNRMSQETLTVMWETIQKNKQPFVDFLTRKAQLFGKEKMDWQDQDAPIILGDLEEKTYSFDQAAAFILENFRKFSPKMADFAQMAFEKSWIEAEDRPGKRPGGYCTELPETQESRIFMTFGNSINEVATLAHELGHAFHSSVMWDLPSLNREYAMNVAETASTFAELIVADATLKEAKSDVEKINLLDTKMQNAIAMFMNIHARFIFENNFYQVRQKGLVAEEDITELMLAAQKESYKDSLGSYHPHFWASKLHFFIDDVPFYNFPYTFGYLFSMGIYAYANQQGSSFEDQYIALLRDTASMTSEELAKKHLNVDLTKPDFWQAGIDQVLKDVEQFMTLTESYVN
ncbi:M3 family oligoendopeptidase [Enterococcus faecalis]|uniref:M3 family oligoendopeptidase n=1 Tax=Enterococcus faecalis TaxID=1351 RepID=UPI001416AAAD|nr:M3 family oligoendopeptidase [Enterococcus faecalis]EIA6621049.1 M3 family oligoendopeptidase [Enterococcus faecalis]EIA6786490.1 M3 family oligoendopeptidase [Enterococcus faecalis]MBP4076200.1 M3 family oligoendopeptidase [Enterococcus faecalis]MBP4094256.1 M3 family oligoendopeptidase [Enterococcus faecalis]NGG30492.1 M3 family oligoendopeptidase [Enterococcus faecalis]